MRPSNGNVETINSYFTNISWSSISNLTQYAPSPRDLFLAPHRLGQKLGTFLFSHPNALIGQTTIPHTTANVGMDTGSAAITEHVAQAGGDALLGNEAVSGIAARFGMESTRSFSNILGYSTSKWAIGCMVMAVVLNRTGVYASTRRNVILGWKMRFALRIIPVLLFAIMARDLLMSIHCQTSPEFATMRWNNASRSSDLMFNQDGGFLHSLSTSFLMGASDESSCVAINMVPTIDQSPPHLDGSLQQLWPLFKTLCFSQFIETLSCALQGIPVSAETGMTLFEHSLAFAEAEAAVGAHLGWGIFGHIRDAQSDSGSGESDIKLSMIMKKVNTPPEVLLVGLLSSMNHLTSHVLGIFNLQGRWRLLSTAFWAICFMSSIMASVWTFDMDDLANQALLRFPTVVIIGFIPHILVFFGIVLCSGIYIIALITTALATKSTIGGRSMTFVEKIAYARENMQANITLSNFQISMRTDFYAALLKTGYAVLTVASDAVYLNESSQVSVKQRTWLEEARLKEIEDSGVKWLGPTFRGTHGDTIDDVGLVNSTDVPAQLVDSESPFAQERVTRKRSKNTGSVRSRNGVGAIERSGRWIMAFDFFVGIASLIGSGSASIMLKILARMGIAYRPWWLTWFIQKPVEAPKSAVAPAKSAMLEFWLLDDDGVLRLPADDNVDVEAEMRKRMTRNKFRWDHNDEQSLDSNLYSWFLNGGWFGSHDTSGQFEPADIDDEDDTSVVSTASEISNNEEEWESDEEDGRRTPTQNSAHYSREGTPLVDTPLSHASLATLLHPRTPEQRSAAQALAAHLSSDRIVTRSQFREILQREHTSILTTTRQLPDKLQHRKPRLSESDEAEILEYIIRSKRAEGVVSAKADNSDNAWSSGASGMGEEGPQCVVCQSAPRSIIVWPCRCLSLCDACRVDLAMNNFDKCVCCRRDVNSFSRIFVP